MPADRSSVGEALENSTRFGSKNEDVRGGRDSRCDETELR